MRIGTLIHETGHHAGLGGDTYEWTWPFPGLSVADRLQNADSFTAFVLANHYSLLPPVVGPTGIGLRVGPGLLFGSGPASPRFVVTAELDVTLARRVFHFFDLHLGGRFDVDTSGNVIYSPYLGPRMFAPTSISRVPLFVDLRAGVALGRVPTQVDRATRELFGPSVEAGIGFQSGHFGASLSYRHIWTLMKNNPDIGVVTIAGELRF